MLPPFQTLPVAYSTGNVNVSVPASNTSFLTHDVFTCAAISVTTFSVTRHDTILFTMRAQDNSRLLTKHIAS